MRREKITIEKLDLPTIEGEQRPAFITIDCPSCQSKVPAENIELASSIAKCTGCQAVFSVQDNISGLQSMEKVREPIKKPEGVDIFHYNDEMEIETLQPFPVLWVILLTLAPFIFLFSLLFYIKEGLTSGMVIALFSSVFIALGAFRVWRRKNYKTYLNFYGDVVTIQNRPGRKSRDKTIYTSEIDQVYVKQNHDGLALYFIINGDKGQRHEAIITRITKMGHAKYIEQEIEKHLKIRDRTVSGEL